MFSLERLAFKPSLFTSAARWSAAASIQRDYMATSTNIPTWQPIFTPIEESRRCLSAEEVTSASVRLVSYNILAQAYVKSALFPHSPSPCLRWKARSQAVLSRLLSLEADLLCVQELDEFESFYKGQLDRHGYSSIYIKRPGKKHDGCGIFYRRERISLVEDKFIQFNDLVPQTLDGGSDGVSSDEDCSATNDRGDPNDPKVRLKRDCVGIIAAFRALHAPDKVFVLANTHIYWDPEWVDVKLAQAKHLVACVAEFQFSLGTKLDCEIPVVICGDFNSTPGDQVYNYLTSGGPEDAKLPKEALECSLLPSLRLHSLYASVKGEPAFTNCTPDFTGTLDYIFFSDMDSLKPVSLLEVPNLDSQCVLGGLPNYSHPSDHLPIGTDFVVVK